MSSVNRVRIHGSLHLDPFGIWDVLFNCEQWRDPDIQNHHANCSRPGDPLAANQSSRTMLTQRGEQGISTLLLTLPQAPRWMAVPTSLSQQLHYRTPNQTVLGKPRRPSSPTLYHALGTALTNDTFSSEKQTMGS